MARTAIKVGQVLPLSGNNDGIDLRVSASTDARVEHWLRDKEKRVKVISISFNRRDLTANSLWIQVQSVTSPTKVGWVKFSCGGWEAGLRLRIDRVVFNQEK